MRSWPAVDGVVLVLCCAACSPAGDQPPRESARWWDQVVALSTDGMQGREAGSTGYAAAADYLAGEFEKLGLAAAGEDGYFQPVPLVTRRLDPRGSSLVLVRPDASEPLVLREDMVFGRELEPGELAASAVFVGHGLVIPELGINDLQGLDLHGKLAVTLRGAPPNVPSLLRAHYSSSREQWAALSSAGAIGVLTILDPAAMDTPWERIAGRATEAQMAVDDPALEETPGKRLSVTLNPERADKLLAGTGHSVASLLALAAEPAPLPKFALPGRVHVRVAAQEERIEARNVVARLEGVDPVLREEVVALSAHLDGLGVGQPFDGDEIYNGTMDNAAGVATLLEIAARLAGVDEPPRRSILFLAVAAEEKGLQGSKYFAHYPTVPLEAIVANLNFDMYLPIIPLQRLEVLGLEESTLGEMIRRLAAERGLVVTSDIEPERVLFIRSDQYSFIRRGIPALSFKFGFEPDSPQHAVMRQWLQQRYHAPSDDPQQPVDRAAAGQFNALMTELVRRIATAERRPRWHEQSFFRRYASEPTGIEKGKRSPVGGGLQAGIASLTEAHSAPASD